MGRFSGKYGKASGFAAGGLLAFVCLAALAEGYLRLFPPRDLYPFLGERSPLSGVYRPDDDFGIAYRSWEDFCKDNALRIDEFLPFEPPSRRKTWAFFGNSFVHMQGMLADTARAHLPDHCIFNLGKIEQLYVRCAQVKLLLENGLEPERIFMTTLTLDPTPLGKQPLSTLQISSRGAMGYRPRLPGGLLGKLVRHSDLAFTAWVRSGRHQGDPSFQPSALNRDIPEPLRTDLTRLFGNLARVTREHHVPVTVVLIPNWEQIVRGAPCGFQDTLTAILQRQGLDVCDCRDVFLRYPDKAALFLPDKHFSKVGNELLFGKLMDHLRDADLVARAGRGQPMTFTELPFWTLAVVVYVLWLFCRKHYQANFWLLFTASVIFYGYHRWHLLALIFAYCVVDWAAGCRMVRSRRPGLVLALGVTFNLAVLAFWKYTPMLVRTVAQLALALDLPEVPAPPDHWLIPFGISFYSFTGIAYMVDVYRRVTEPETSFWRYTLSAMFFPHLVAGPILRPEEFLTRLRPETMPARPEAPAEALLLIGRGFFKKMVLADRIAQAIDPFLTHVGDGSTAGAWSLPFIWLYALQIYFDFSGYTDIARGLGLLFGFRWPDNFNRPYLATSVQDFWRRWHITLSAFLKDYLYVPLGGSRLGPWRTYGNLMLTMLLGGLWHGASWSFALWGALHGGFLVVNRLWGQLPARQWLASRDGVLGRLWQGLAVLLTFHAVCLNWCFFRLTEIGDSFACVRKWFVFDLDKALVGGAADVSLWLLLVTYGLLVWVAQRWSRANRLAEAEWNLSPFRREFFWGTAAALLVLAVLLSPGGGSPPFIYFQF